MESTGALTVVATVTFSMTHLDTLIINASRTEQWCCSNGVAWHRQAGRHAGACMAKKKYQGPGPCGMPEKEHVGVTGPRGQGTREAEVGIPQRYLKDIPQRYTVGQQQKCGASVGKIHQSKTSFDISIGFTEHWAPGLVDHIQADRTGPEQIDGQTNDET